MGAPEEKQLATLQLMLEHATQVAMAVFEAPSGRLLQSTPRYRRMLKHKLGTDGEGTSSRSWENLWFGPTEGLNAFHDVASSGEPRRFAEVRVSEGDQTFIWDCSLLPIRGAGDSKMIRHVMLSCVEVTDPILARDQLRRQDYLKDEFLSMASHELRTPLTPITTYTELMSHLLDQKQRGPQWEAQMQHIIGRLQKQVRHMSRLTDDLLDSARLQSRKFTLNLRPTYVRLIVSEAVDQVVSTGPVPPIRQDLQVDGDSRVMADELRASQVIHNLLSNALRHAPESERIDLRVRPVSENGRVWVRIEVQDYGAGVPLEDRQELFTRFFQSSQRKEQTSRGLGVGLYIARQIVEQHGGCIGVDFNDPGSTFWVELPLLEP